MHKLLSSTLALSLATGLLASPGFAQPGTTPPGTGQPGTTPPGTGQPPAAALTCPGAAFCNPDKTVQVTPVARSFFTPEKKLTNLQVLVTDATGKPLANEQVRFVLKNRYPSANDPNTREVFLDFTVTTDAQGRADAFRGSDHIDFTLQEGIFYRWMVYARGTDVALTAFRLPKPKPPVTPPAPRPPRFIPDECLTSWYCNDEATVLVELAELNQLTPDGNLADVRVTVKHENDAPAANEFVLFILKDADTDTAVHQEIRQTNPQGKANLLGAGNKIGYVPEAGKRLHWLIVTHDGSVEIPSFVVPATAPKPAPKPVPQPPSAPGPVAPNPVPQPVPTPSNSPTPSVSPTPTPSPSIQPGAVTETRIGGRNRIETAIQVNKARKLTPVKRIFIASADNPADAIAVAPLAAMEQAPIYLTWKDKVDSSLAKELSEIVTESTQVTILGGPVAINDDVAKALAGKATRVSRLAGLNRADTATKVADELVSTHKIAKVIVADGQGWQAPIVAGPAAIASKQIILLSNGSASAPETNAWLSAHKVDLTTTLGKASEAHKATRVINEPDGPALSLAVAKAFFNKPTNVGFATTHKPSDAMVAGPFLHDGPILLVDKGLSQGQRDWLKAQPAQVHTIFGGKEAIESL